MSDVPGGLDDPDNWRGFWLYLHASELFAGELARFALARLTDPVEGVGSGSFEFEERGHHYHVNVDYLLEPFQTGWVLHILTIRSPGDPLPPQRV